MRSRESSSLSRAISLPCTCEGMWLSMVPTLEALLRADSQRADLGSQEEVAQGRLPAARARRQRPHSLQRILRLLHTHTTTSPGRPQSISSLWLTSLKAASLPEGRTHQGAAPTPVTPRPASTDKCLQWRGYKCIPYGPRLWAATPVTLTQDVHTRRQARSMRRHGSTPARQHSSPCPSPCLLRRQPFPADVRESARSDVP